MILKAVILNDLMNKGSRGWVKCSYSPSVLYFSNLWHCSISQSSSPSSRISQEEVYWSKSYRKFSKMFTQCPVYSNHHIQNGCHVQLRIVNTHLQFGQFSDCRTSHSLAQHQDNTHTREYTAVWCDTWGSNHISNVSSPWILITGSYIKLTIRNTKYQPASSAEQSIPA